jgi:hypothetical protein
VKLISFLPVLFAIAIKGFGQYADTEQPDSIYRINKVKKRIARYENYGFQNCNVNYYDLNGTITERTMFDKSGKKFWIRTLFEYDASGKLIKEFFHSYMNHDTATGIEKPDDILDSSKISSFSFEYDSSNRLIKITGNTLLLKTPYEASFSYGPLTSVEKFYKLNDSMETIAITVYETPHIKKSYFSSYDSAVVTKNTWQETYESSFDKSGNVLKSIYRTPGDPSYCLEIIYEYNSKGLLIKKFNRRNGSEFGAIIFDYEYRDNNEYITASKIPGKFSFPYKSRQVRFTIPF